MTAVGLFERARECQARLEEEERAKREAAAILHEAYLKQESLKTATLIRTIFGVDAEMQAHRYGNEYPVLGGVLIGPIWFEPIGDFSMKAVYTCPDGCYDYKDVRWKTFMSGAEDEVTALAQLAKLFDNGCTYCGYHSKIVEPSDTTLATSQGVNP